MTCTVADAALRRALSALDHHVLKVAAHAAGPRELGDRLDALDASIADVLPALHRTRARTASGHSADAEGIDVRGASTS